MYKIWLLLDTFKADKDISNFTHCPVESLNFHSYCSHIASNLVSTSSSSERALSKAFLKVS